MPASSTGSATALPGNHSSAEDSRLDWQAGVSYPSSSTLKHYYANGRRIATRDSEGLKFYHLDHLGSTSRVTNQGGAQVRVIRYDPWGYSQAVWGSGTALVKYTYTGKELDAGTGLMYYGARYYDPALGMFLSPDTVVPEPGNPQSLNRYAYVLNNPLIHVDPDGHFAFVPFLIAGGVGALVGAGVDLGKQLIVDQKNIRNVNWAEVGGAAAGGLVAGATLGLAPAGASIIGLGLLGGVGSAAGSQAQALTQAGLEELFGTNPQGSVIAEAKNLGLLDAKTMMLNAGAGMVMGSLGGKFAGLLRSKLNLPEAAGTIRLSGELPQVRWQMRLDQPGVWTAQLEGRVIKMDADTFEKIVRAMAIGGYQFVEETLEEAIQQGTVQVLEEGTQP